MALVLAREGKEFCESPISRFLFEYYIRGGKLFVRGASKYFSRIYWTSSTLRTNSAQAPAFRHSASRLSWSAVGYCAEPFI